MRTYFSSLFTVAVLLAPVACDEAAPDPDQAETNERIGGGVLSPDFIAAYLSVDEASQEELALGMGLAREELVAGLSSATPDTSVRYLGGGVFENIEADDAASGSDFTPGLDDLTAGTSISKGEACIPVVGWASVCYEKAPYGVFLRCKIGWEDISINSPKLYYGLNGMCFGGGAETILASATYSLCYYNPAPNVVQPFFLFTAEACLLDNCKIAGTAKNL